MSRRAVLPLLLLALGLAAGVLVARVPPDFDGSVVTRRHHGSDPLQTAVLLRFDVESLLTRPSEYFHPPFLYPDPNPQRGTEPLIAEALLAVPFRLVLGDRPAPIYTSVRIFTLALLALATGLMLRELGVRDSLALLGGALVVLVATTAVFVDRLQAVSLQWLPLAVLFAIRFWRRGRALDATAFAACVFLTVQASLYSTAMLLAAAPFLAPLLWTARGEPGAVRRGAGLAAGTAAAGVLSVLTLWPWLHHRADVAAYASPEFTAEKSWGVAYLADVLTSPPEWPWGPAAGWDGVFPGFAFVLAAACALAFALADRFRGRAEAPDSRPFVLSGRILFASLALLLAVVTGSVVWGPSGLTRVAADTSLWIALVAWGYRLAAWPSPWAETASRLRFLASVASFAALLWTLFSLGSPIRQAPFAAPLLEGLFGPVAGLLDPIREMRELKRFLLPAGWAAVVGLVLVIERGLRGRSRAWAPVLAAVILAVGLGERIRADTRKVRAPPPPLTYALLADSGGTGGLLELPFDHWGRIRSVHRMLWQPSHGRPIVAGKTGIDPGWYTPAREVFNEFPSEESLHLMQAWGVDTVLERRPASRPRNGPEALPPGLAWRGQQGERGGRGDWHLFDLLAPSGAASPLLAEPSPGPGEWRRLSPASGTDAEAVRATDGSLHTAGEVSDPEGLVLVPPGGSLVALELDYGPGRFNRVPRDLQVLGLESGAWRDLTPVRAGAFLRARAAHQLLKRQSARLVIPLRASTAGRLRLVSTSTPWDLPEVRARVVDSD